MIRSVKEKLGERQLQQALKIHVRQKSFLNIEEVRSVGIVFEATDPEELERVKKYAAKLKQMAKRVHAIGFIDAKITAPNLNYPKAEFDLFNLKDLQRINAPSSPYIKTFITEIRDLLIDINLNNKFPLRYIAAMSYAKCKIGLAIPENTGIHDMLINMEPTQGTNKYLEQVDRYLEMINKS